MISKTNNPKPIMIDKSVQASLKAPDDIEALARDTYHLLEEKILTDVTLKSGSQTFRAHRSILAARSKVFQSLFQAEVLNEGARTEVVDMPFMDITVLEQLLKFVYSGELDDIADDTGFDLYEFAHRYMMFSLVSACAYWIKRNLTVENCIRYLKSADSHEDNDLKNVVVQFIIENRIVMKSDSWLSFSKEFPELANEVYQSYVDLYV